MRVEIKVTVSSDDGKVSRASTNAVMMATDVENADPGVQKQDFLTQVEGLVRTVGENQVPALYAAVESAVEEAKAEDAEQQGQPEDEAAQKLAPQLSKWRKKGEQAEQVEAVTPEVAE